MQLHYYKGRKPNFGDDINPWMWQQLLPNFFDEDESTAFLGIGSILGMNSFAPSVKKIVMGSGFVPEYHSKPKKNENYKFYFVRGPRTAELLGLDKSLGLGDPASILLELMKNEVRTQEVISFMPHWESTENGNWKEVCLLANLNYIDPCTPIEDIFAQILKSKLVITEAMHGAIVCDALGIPWIPVIPINKAHRAKWRDWADTLNIDLPIYKIWPSSVEESRLSFLKNPIKNSIFVHLINKLLIVAAAKRLSSIGKKKPLLSDRNLLKRNVAMMLDKIDILKKEYQSK